MTKSSRWSNPGAVQRPLQLQVVTAPPPLREKRGAVYTKPWVVELILDLAGYSPERNLVDTFAVEPAAGSGAFLRPMARRLVESCRRHGRSLSDLDTSLLAYELDEPTAGQAKAEIDAELHSLGVETSVATRLVDEWIRFDDYLIESPALPQADFVIGNPPYIRLENIDEATAVTYRSAYRTMRGRADIYIGFIEAALRQLSEEGVCAFICADRWMMNQYGRALRKLVTDDYDVETIIEMHDAGAFIEDVSAYPAVIVIRRANQGPVAIARISSMDAGFDTGQIAGAIENVRTHDHMAILPEGVNVSRVESWFQGADPWPIASPRHLRLLKSLEDEFPVLENSETGTKVGIGVATGADDVFITADANLVEPSRMLPLALASDIVDGEFRWSGHYLIDPWDDEALVDLDRFPQLKAYVEEHSQVLGQRHVAKKRPGSWYRTIDRVNHTLTRRPKLYVPDIKDRLHPVLDNGQTYPHHNLYVIHSEAWDLEVLGGLLLSEVAQFFIASYAVRMRGGYLRFQAQYLRKIRVPNPGDLSTEQEAGLAEAFRRHDVDQATEIALSAYGIDHLPAWEPS